MNRFWKKLLLITISLIIVSSVFLYIRFKPDDKGMISPWGESIDVSVLPDFHSSLNDQKSLVIYEGLPHQIRESELLKSEIRDNDTTKIHSFHFYSESIKPSQNDAELIIAALRDKDGINEWAGMKLCGGYHPDYTIQWIDSEGTNYEALVCFGCQEIKLYGNNIQLYAELNDKLYNTLKKILSQYGNQRPTEKMDSKIE